ncbi:helix-turn-helix transcriptional regulator [Streptomyces sp. SBT349]|uniref:helix-turn-helix transcriptional regulator n=1 Tax=Streptomyces sp. SBT349 TaxID=1580539 RepID=UPI00066C5255|nr:helix-turn-helix transcriptional regulator [Streptomyces sp. SBT349]
MPPADPPRPGLVARRRAIGDRIRDARLNANLTQEGLRDRTALSRDTIIRIEAGTTDARLSWLLLIADAVGTDLADLVREDGPRPPQT